MSQHWITGEDATGMSGRQSCQSMSPHHVQTLVRRNKIGTQAFPNGRTLLTQSDVQTTRVAADTGKNHRSRVLSASLFDDHSVIFQTGFCEKGYLCLAANTSSPERYHLFTLVA
jgi:hypothetical protein